MFSFRGRVRVRVTVRVTIRVKVRVKIMVSFRGRVSVILGSVSRLWLGFSLFISSL